MEKKEKKFSLLSRRSLRSSIATILLLLLLQQLGGSLTQVKVTLCEAAAAESYLLHGRKTRPNIEKRKFVWARTNIVIPPLDPTVDTSHSRCVKEY